MRPGSSEHELDASTNEDVATHEPIQPSSATHHIALQDFAHPSPTLQEQYIVHRDVGNEETPTPQKEEKPQRPSILPRASSIARHTSFLDEDEVPPTSPSPSSTPLQQNKPGPIAWRDLPQKSQLAILTLARLSEPLTQTSLQAYMFYQLRSFNPSLPSSTISAQAGMLQGSFTAAQFVTAILWGRMADAEWGGRKRVLLIGLAGTGVSCVGFGFSRTFWQAMVCRTLGGALNGNVGVMRTMISEIIKEKRFQSRAFLLLPMCFNIGMCWWNCCWDLSLMMGIPRCYYWTDLGGIAFGSREQLSECLWGELAVWRGEWGLLAQALALCSSKSYECGFPVHLCHGSCFRA